MSKKALVAVSGGVDSSVAAYLLKSRGYDVTAIMLRLYDKADPSGSLMQSDRADAEAVCGRLSIPFVYADYREQFKEDVIARFAMGYISGATPNPCVECNRHVKFRYVFDYADAHGFDVVTTGHYARVSFCENSGRYVLKKGVDTSKDQSYVLYALSQSQLCRLILPLGELSKSEVRNIAGQNGLANANKHDSQDICFISGNYYDFISKFTGRDFPPGDFIDTSGKVLGRHKGIIRYTRGQRKGLGLSFEAPKYVLSKDLTRNTVTLGDESGLYSSVVTAGDVNFISVAKINGTLHAQACVRYNQKPMPASVTVDMQSRLVAVFDSPQRAVTGGQSLVVYDGDEVVAGGTIIE